MLCEITIFKVSTAESKKKENIEITEKRLFLSIGKYTNYRRILMCRIQNCDKNYSILSKITKLTSTSGISGSDIFVQIFSIKRQRSINTDSKVTNINKY